MTQEITFNEKGELERISGYIPDLFASSLAYDHVRNKLWWVNEGKVYMADYNNNEIYFYTPFSEQTNLQCISVNFSTGRAIVGGKFENNERFNIIAEINENNDEISYLRTIINQNDENDENEENEEELMDIRDIDGIGEIDLLLTGYIDDFDIQINQIDDMFYNVSYPSLITIYVMSQEDNSPTSYVFVYDEAGNIIGRTNNREANVINVMAQTPTTLAISGVGGIDAKISLMPSPPSDPLPGLPNDPSDIVILPEPDGNTSISSTFLYNLEKSSLARNKDWRIEEIGFFNFPKTFNVVVHQRRFSDLTFPDNEVIVSYIDDRKRFLGEEEFVFSSKFSEENYTMSFTLDSLWATITFKYPEAIDYIKIVSDGYVMIQQGNDVIRDPIFLLPHYVFIAGSYFRAYEFREGQKTRRTISNFSIAPYPVKPFLRFFDPLKYGLDGKRDIIATWRCSDKNGFLPNEAPTTITYEAADQSINYLIATFVTGEALPFWLKDTPVISNLPIGGSTNGSQSMCFYSLGWGLTEMRLAVPFGAVNTSKAFGIPVNYLPNGEINEKYTLKAYPSIKYSFAFDGWKGFLHGSHVNYFDSVEKTLYRIWPNDGWADKSALEDGLEELLSKDREWITWVIQGSKNNFASEDFIKALNGKTIENCGFLHTDYNEAITKRGNHSDYLTVWEDGQASFLHYWSGPSQDSPRWNLPGWRIITVNFTEENNRIVYLQNTRRVVYNGSYTFNSDRIKRLNVNGWWSGGFEWTIELN